MVYTRGGLTSLQRMEKFNEPNSKVIPVKHSVFHASINKWLNYQKSDIYMSFGIYMKISCEQPNKMFSVQQ